MKEEIAEEILELLEEYYHYKFMTSGFFSHIFGNNHQNLNDFREWLKSKLAG